MPRLPGRRLHPAPDSGLAGYPHRHRYRPGSGAGGESDPEKLAGSGAGCYDRRRHYTFLAGVSNDHQSTCFARGVPPADVQRPPSLALAHFPLAIPALVTAPGIAAIVAFMAMTEGDWSQKGIVIVLLLLIMTLNLLALLNVGLIFEYVSPTILLIVGWVMAVLQTALAIQYIVNALVRLGALPTTGHWDKLMELIHSLHGGLESFVSFLKFILESISAFCVAIGLVTSLVMAVGFARRSSRLLENLPAVRLQFGSWLALALEFQLGADIVATTINPTLQSLGELGLLAVIRTFLNYFLGKELETEERIVKERQQKKALEAKDTFAETLAKPAASSKEDGAHGK